MIERRYRIPRYKVGDKQDPEKDRVDREIRDGRPRVPFDGIVIQLPRVAVSRALAKRLVGDMRGISSAITINARSLVVSNQAFADELVMSIRATGTHAPIENIGGSPMWQSQFRQALGPRDAEG